MRIAVRRATADRGPPPEWIHVGRPHAQESLRKSVGDGGRGEIDRYAVDEAIDPAFQFRFRVFSAHYVDVGGNDFWGVQPHRPLNDETTYGSTASFARKGGG